MTPIYKRDTAGNVRLWIAEIDGDRYRITTGLVEGKRTTSAWTTAKARNVGRTNETSGEAQALKEVAALRKKKLDVDYHESIERIDEAKVFKPMLATKWSERAHRVDWSGALWANPKLDGIRAIATRRGLHSRKGKPIGSARHIERALAPLFEADPDLVIDGELYNHELQADFQRIVSLVRRERPSPEQRAEAEALIQYHPYDIVRPASYERRHEALAVLIDSLDAGTRNVVRLVTRTRVRDESDLAAVAEAHLASGYEGTMIRLDEPGYEPGKRSASLMKHKVFDDAEFEVVGFESADGNWQGTAKKALVRCEDGRIATATMKGTREFLTHVWEDRDAWTGRTATVRFFGRTGDGNLRFPIVQIIHESERI